MPCWAATLHVVNDAALHDVAADGASLLQYMTKGFLGRLSDCKIRLIGSFADGLCLLHLVNGKARLVADELPVVLHFLPFHHIAINIPLRGTGQRLALAGCREFDEDIVLRMSRTWFIVVANEITLVRTTFTGFVLTAIAGIAATPVEVDIVLVFQEHVLVDIRIGSAVDASRATVVADQQVVVERSG